MVEKEGLKVTRLCRALRAMVSTEAAWCLSLRTQRASVSWPTGFARRSRTTPRPMLSLFGAMVSITGFLLSRGQTWQDKELEHTSEGEIRDCLLSCSSPPLMGFTQGFTFGERTGSRPRPRQSATTTCLPAPLRCTSWGSMPPDPQLPPGCRPRPTVTPRRPFPRRRNADAMMSTVGLYDGIYLWQYVPMTASLLGFNQSAH